MTRAKKTYLVAFILLTSITSYAQVGISLQHHSHTFMGLGYQVRNVVPEVRFNFAPETVDLLVTYILEEGSILNGYIGLGVSDLGEPDIMIPLGIHAFPFKKKKFGFQMEITGILNREIIRSSWGIKYLFK